ncbi:hypothetical protein CTRI78_v000079 [Colletotrichum trifolii]|uniref:Uncharacterized protein n=1 Tax=Colletotrichum trifolii TaxID=5466 RepID=A0A4V3HXZ9_COLTR|nr:hypothetical protein CTRI78_v000079 [Colletotrichum trifolii]
MSPKSGASASSKSRSKDGNRPRAQPEKVLCTCSKCTREQPGGKLLSPRTKAEHTRAQRKVDQGTLAENPCDRCVKNGSPCHVELNGGETINSPCSTCTWLKEKCPLLGVSQRTRSKTSTQTPSQTRSQEPGQDGNDGRKGANAPRPPSPSPAYSGPAEGSRTEMPPPTEASTDKKRPSTEADEEERPAKRQKKPVSLLSVFLCLDLHPMPGDRPEDVPGQPVTLPCIDTLKRLGQLGPLQPEPSTPAWNAGADLRDTARRALLEMSKGRMAISYLLNGPSDAESTARGLGAP